MKTIAFPIIFAKAVSAVVSGAVGIVAYNGAKRLRTRLQFARLLFAPPRSASGQHGESKSTQNPARLAVSDVVAEFRDRLGEEDPPPGGIRDRPRTLALYFDDRTDMPTLTEAHPYADIYLFLPGLGVILGTRVLGEFGDDANR